MSALRKADVWACEDVIGKDCVANDYDSANNTTIPSWDGTFEALSTIVKRNPYIANDNCATKEPVADIRLRQKALLKLASVEQILDGARLNQIHAIEALKQKLEDDSWNLTGYFVQPTGAGKTVLFGLLVKALELKTLILVPKTLLLQQTKDELVKVLGIPESEIGLVGDGFNDHNKSITISTYQSHLANFSGEKKWYRDILKKIELLICDEAHKSLGDATQETLNLEQITDEELVAEETAMMEVNQQLGRDVLKLAFTATPKLSLKSVRKVFGETEISRDTYVNMVKSGVLVPFRMHHTEGYIIEGTDFEEGREMTLDEESKVLARERTYQKLLDIYADLHTSSTDKLRTAVFCSSIAECDKFIELANNEYGLKCIRVTSKDDKEALKRAEDGLLNGTYDMVVTVDKLTEGWNFPPLNTVINARATNSPARLLQSCGRASRKFEGKRWANIIETNWLVGKTVDQRNDNENSAKSGNTQTGENSTKEVKARKALNLMEALIVNGEDQLDLGIVCLGVDGEAIIYKSLKLQEKNTIIDALKQKLTPQRWALMKQKEKRAYKLQPGNYGLKAIATILEVEGNPIGHRDIHLALGRSIWGELEYLKSEEKVELTKEQLINTLKQKFTPQQWALMKNREKLAYKMQPGNYGLISLATILEVEGNPINNHDIHLAMGREIWGDLECLKSEEKVDRTKKQLIDALKQEFTPQQWALMQQKEKKPYKLQPGNYGLCALSTIFGIEGNPISHHDIHLALGRSIWGELECLKSTKPTKEQLINTLKLEFTPQQWALMKYSEKLAYKMQPGNYGLTALARILDLEGVPTNNHDIHLAMGRAIWGDLDCLKSKV